MVDYTKGAGSLGTYIAISVVIIYLYYQINLAAHDEKAFTKNFTYNILMIVVPTILILGLVVFTSFEKDVQAHFISGAILACVIVFFVFYFLKTNLSTYIFNNYLLYTVIALLIVIGLSIIFTLFSGTLRKLNGWTGFFVNLLFYIPCLVRDFIKALIQESNTSSTTVLVLFVFEILLIILYFLIIPLINDKSFPEKTVILNDPVMLNTKMDFATCDIAKNATNTNFAISMWIYLNSAPKTKKSYMEETTIFNYSDQTGEKPHIKITYFNNKNGSNDFIMYVESQKFTISLPLQKWNNFVINYTSADPETKNPIKKEIYLNGDTYQGEIKMDGSKSNKHGKGTLSQVDGTIYEGQWKDNEKHGLGKMTDPTGKLIEGEWVKGEQTKVFTYVEKTGEFTGKGTIEIVSVSSKESYEGDIKNGQKHGYGTNTSNTGYWSNDDFVGSEDNWLKSAETNIPSKNYIIDIFINGILERSYTSGKMPIFNKYDIMSIGQQDIGNTFQGTGLYGSICNIVYYKKPLSQLAIIYNYNLLTIKNPPISY